MRRRSKVKVVWLPTTNAFSGDQGNPAGLANTTTWQITSQTVFSSIQGDHEALEIPVTLDGSGSAPLNPTSSLADIENSGYRLRRIVGKVYVFISQSTDDPTVSVIGVTAGFMVRRVDGGGIASLASSVPAVGGEVLAQVNPVLIDNSMDPWIWRRSWLLGDNGTANNGTLSTAVPAQNFGFQYPGPLEGPHVDQKTARIVGPEERLFLDVGYVTLLPRTTNSSIVVITDLRILASMRSNIGNRRNASR